MQFTKLFAISLAILFGAAGVTHAAKPDSAIMDTYIKIQEALAADTVAGVPEAARDLSKKAAQEPKIKKAAEALAATKDIKSARNEFKALSDAVIAWNKTAKNPGVEEVFCSMVPASWLQKSGPVANPYYGKQMLRCGEKR